MLQIKQICKQYKTGDLVQKALDGVNLNLRDNEFVAILGPSGSGKTTLLNVIGGLDRYDSGDLIINGISTKKYKDADLILALKDDDIIESGNHQQLLAQNGFYAELYNSQFEQVS